MSLLLLAATLAAGPLADVQRHSLDNGLTVLLLEDHRAPLVSVAVMYRAGAGNEAPGITGVAHYVEHMAFRDLEDFPGSEATDSVTRLGGRWNGYTWIDQTYYAETVAREALEHVLEIEAQRMRSALFRTEAFEQERTSVLAELHSYDDPHSLLYDAVLATSFEIHPYRYNTIGWLSDVELLTRDDAYGFYRRHYHPANAVLVVVGDMDPGVTLRLVEQHFGALEAGGASSEIRTLEPRQTGPKRVEVRRPGPHAEVLIAYRAPALAEADFPALVLFDALLGGAKGLRFTSDYAVPSDTRLRRATVGAGLARDATSDWQASRYPYVYLIGAEAATGADLQALESALLRAVESAAGTEWSDAEILAALQGIRRGMSLDHDTLAGRAHQLAFFEVSGSHRHLLELPEQLARVTREDLARFAARRLQPAQATVGWFVPTDAVPEAPPASPREGLKEEPFEAHGPEPPALGPPPAGPVTFRLDNGLEVSVAPSPASELVALTARIDAGSVYDGATPGLSALAVEHLAAPGSGPTVRWTLHERPTAAANARWIELEAYCLQEELDALLRNLAARLRAPVPRGPGWSSLVEAARHRAEAAAAGTEGATWQTALRLLYPSGAALASPAWARSEAFAVLDAAALARFLSRYVTPSRTHLALAGAVDPGSLRRDVAGTAGRLGGCRNSQRARAGSPARDGPVDRGTASLPRQGAERDSRAVAGGSLAAGGRRGHACAGLPAGRDVLRGPPGPGARDTGPRLLGLDDARRGRRSGLPRGADRGGARAHAGGAGADSQGPGGSRRGRLHRRGAFRSQDVPWRQGRSAVGRHAALGSGAAAAVARNARASCRDAHAR